MINDNNALIIFNSFSKVKAFCSQRSEVPETAPKVYTKATNITLMN